MDVNYRIKDQIENNPVLLYMKGTPDFPQCGFSGQTVAALKAIGKPFAYVNIFEDPEIRDGLGLFELAHVSAVVRQWRVGGRLRHRRRDVSFG